MLNNFYFEEMDIINPIKGSLSKGSDVAVEVAYFKINSCCRTTVTIRAFVPSYCRDVLLVSVSKLVDFAKYSVMNITKYCKTK